MRHIYVTGDPHGDFRYIKKFCEEKKTKKQDVLIVLGDAGINYFFNHRDKNTKDFISKLPITLFMIRGNHEERPENVMQENPNDWDIGTFFENKVIFEKAYPNIKYPVDGQSYYITNVAEGEEYDADEACYEYHEYHALVIGGAYSVDKNYRLMRGWSWFPAEQLDEKEREEILDYCDWLMDNDQKVDCVLSHTCPVSWEPTDLFLPSVNQKEVDKSTEIFLEDVLNRIHPTAWLFGHYHDDRYYPFEDIKTMMLFHAVIDFDDFMTLDKPHFMFTY